MNKIMNIQKIKKITMKPIAYTKCELGQDYYENKLIIEFEPTIYYPDYTEITNWIMENIDGEELNIEDVVNIIYKKLDEEYKPKSLKVIDVVENCKTHFNVVVEK